MISTFKELSSKLANINFDTVKLNHCDEAKRRIHIERLSRWKSALAIPVLFTLSYFILDYGKFAVIEYIHYHQLESQGKLHEGELIKIVTRGSSDKERTYAIVKYSYLGKMHQGKRRVYNSFKDHHQIGEALPIQLLQDSPRTFRLVEHDFDERRIWLLIFIYPMGAMFLMGSIFLLSEIFQYRQKSFQVGHFNDTEDEKERWTLFLQELPIFESWALCPPIEEQHSLVILPSRIPQEGQALKDLEKKFSDARIKTAILKDQLLICDHKNLLIFDQRVCAELSPELNFEYLLVPEPSIEGAKSWLKQNYFNQEEPSISESGAYYYKDFWLIGDYSFSDLKEVTKQLVRTKLELYFTDSNQANLLIDSITKSIPFNKEGGGVHIGMTDTNHQSQAWLRIEDNKDALHFIVDPSGSFITVTTTTIPAFMKDRNIIGKIYHVLFAPITLIGIIITSIKALATRNPYKKKRNQSNDNKKVENV